MDYGKKSNAELLQMIADGNLAFGDKAFAVDINKGVWFNGIVWVSDCSCEIIGVIAICNDPSHSCEPVTEASGIVIIIDTPNGADYSGVVDYSPIDYYTN